MTDIKTLDDLQQKMSDEFAWRKKELHWLRTQVDINQSTRHQDTSIRAAIAILYANWEGLVKNISGLYVDFVKSQRLKNRELSSNFLALTVGKLVRTTASGTLQPCFDLVEFFASEMDSRNKISWTGAINTKSNLNSAVFREITMILGIDYSRYATKEKIIDQKLVENRNHIAHGHFLAIDFAEYVEIHGEVFGIMQDFFDQVEKLAISGDYRSKKPEQLS